MEAWARRAGVELAEDGPIFANLRADPTGRTPFAPGWLSGRWQHLRRQTGVGPVKLHGLRHLQASILVAGGVPVTAAQQRLGHAAAATTLAVYAHALAASEELAAAVVGEALRPSVQGPPSPGRPSVRSDRDRPDGGALALAR